MLGGGNRKKLQQLSRLKDVNGTGDSYRTGTEMTPETL
jgi:hypothetical protein